MLWQKRDTALLAHFTNQIQDPAEKERGWQRYRQIVEFAQSRLCRHRQICLHFGETPKWTSCDSCDVCSGLPEWLAARTQAGLDAKSGMAEGVRSYAKPGVAYRANTSGTSAEVDPELRSFIGVNTPEELQSLL